MLRASRTAATIGKIIPAMLKKESVNSRRAPRWRPSYMWVIRNVPIDMVIPLTRPSTNMAAENRAMLWLSIRPATAATISTKPKRSWVFSGTISISQAFRKIEIRIPALRKVKVLLMLETGSWK